VNISNCNVVFTVEDCVCVCNGVCVCVCMNKSLYKKV